MTLPINVNKNTCGGLFSRTGLPHSHLPTVPRKHMLQQHIFGSGKYELNSIVRRNAISEVTEGAVHANDDALEEPKLSQINGLVPFFL